MSRSSSHTSRRSKPFGRRIAPLACVALLIPAAGLLAACGDDAGDDSSAATTTVSTAPRTITHKLGSVKIEGTPKRVVTLGLGDNDAALAVGVTPVGMVKGSSFGNGLLPWVNTTLGTKKTTVLNLDSGTPYEKIAALTPDLILAMGAFSINKDYAKLSKVAPTIAYVKGNFKDTYQEQTKVIAKALGRDAEGGRVLTDVEAKVAAVKKAHPDFEGKSATLAFMSDANTLNVVSSPDDPAILLLGQVGVGLSKSVQTLPKTGRGGIQGALGLEQVGRLEADALIITYASKALQRQLEANAAFKELDVVKRGGYSEIDLDTVTGLRTPSVLSVPYGLDKLTAALEKATS
jgi:iron complex transport system substrate-binding protein